MHKKRALWIIGATFVALLLAGTVGLATAFAQEETPPPPTADTLPPFGGPGLGRAGTFGRGLFGGGGWRIFDTVAETLGLTPTELFTRLHDGATLEEIAEEQDVAMDEIQSAVSAARAETMRQSIEQAVEDGRITQEQANWMLEGLDKGYLPMGRGMGRGLGRRWGCPMGDND